MIFFFQKRLIKMSVALTEFHCMNILNILFHVSQRIRYIQVWNDKRESKLQNLQFLGENKEKQQFVCT